MAVWPPHWSCKTCGVRCSAYAQGQHRATRAGVSIRKADRREELQRSPHGVLSRRQQNQDLASAGFGYCIERIGGRRRSSHEQNNTFPYRNMSSAFHGICSSENESVCSQLSPLSLRFPRMKNPSSLSVFAIFCCLSIDSLRKPPHQLTTLLRPRKASSPPSRSITSGSNLSVNMMRSAIAFSPKPTGRPMTALIVQIGPR